MNDTHRGKMTVWRTGGPPEAMAFELSANLTAGGERLIVLDAAGYFDPSRVSRAAPSVATNLHVLRTTPGSEWRSELWSELQSVQQRTHARRVLLTGILDHLYDRGIVTREAARGLGRIKLVLEALVRSGLDITVVCGAESSGTARAFLIASLCASACEVRYWPSGAEEYVDGASAAIA